jgi:gamma-glutamylcyclotransferase (GGCT)/AIG2-like uncharacterized protein YtfP
LNQNPTRNKKLYSIVAYGTLITTGYWKDKVKVETCLIKHFSRILPRSFRFPVVLPSEKSFWGLKFDINHEQLLELDIYEGLDLGLFKREKIKVQLKDQSLKKAFIYRPTDGFVSVRNISLEEDECDRWKTIIKKDSELRNLFPELIL